MPNTFDSTSIDAQGTHVLPVDPIAFDIGRYCDYEAQLREQLALFCTNDTGIAVYRRFRVPSVFSYASGDMKLSLSLQLGALQESMRYKTDIPNFLEPWYGIGTIASAFGIDYKWHPGQAPAIIPPYMSAHEVARQSPIPVEQTAIGKNTLAMIEYFLEKTGHRIPMSLSDTQSPMNILSFLIKTDQFILDFYDHPDEVRTLLFKIAKLAIQFTQKQIELIGDCLVWPGHGFASSCAFKGIGMSDDILTLLSPQIYKDFAIPDMARFGNTFGGTCFHSCGNWTNKISVIKQIPNLLMVDGAFSPQTDPSYNPPEIVAEAFANTGIVIHARIVGNTDTILSTVKKLWRPGIKLIAATYCQTPGEQEFVYDRIHELVG